MKSKKDIVLKLLIVLRIIMCEARVIDETNWNESRSKHLCGNNPNVVAEQMYNEIIRGKYDDAINHSYLLHSDPEGNLALQRIVNNLLINNKRSAMNFAYKLYNSDREMLRLYYPTIIDHLMDKKYVNVVNSKRGQALKLSVNKDSYSDRQGWGDANDKTSDRVKWRLIPLWENDEVSFLIKDFKYGMYLKPDVNVDSYGDRLVWGTYSGDEYEDRLRWVLEPAKWDGKKSFYIINRKYGQALKLDKNTDSYGDRLLWTSGDGDGNIYGDPERFGWVFTPMSC